MSCKPITIRTALITTAAMTTGSAAGAGAETIAAHAGYTGLGVGPTVTAIIAVWMLDKLNALIDEPK